MKINVTVDVSDMYAEKEGESFSESIKFAIKHEVTQAVLKDWREKIGAKFNDEVTSAIDQMRDGVLAATIQECISRDDVREDKWIPGGKRISLKDYAMRALENGFNDRNFMTRIESIVESRSKELAAEMKTRFDMLFASQLVAKMNQNNMLREDVAKMLLDAP